MPEKVYFRAINGTEFRFQNESKRTRMNQNFTLCFFGVSSVVRGNGTVNALHGADSSRELGKLLADAAVSPSARVMDAVSAYARLALRNRPSDDHV